MRTVVATLAGLMTLANISAQAVPLPPVHFTIARADSVPSLAKPAASVSTDAALAVCFAPEEDCVAFAVRAIDYAEREILVSAYGLTVGSGIAEALVRAKARGVDVRFITDRRSPCGRGSAIEPLAAGGVLIWIDHRLADLQFFRL